MSRRLPHIVCYAPYTNWSIHSAREVTILQALRLRGCSVSYVTCDGVYGVCDMTHPANGAALVAGSHACLVCQSSVAARLAAWGMPYRWLGRWLRSSDFADADAWLATLRPQDYATASHGDWAIGPWVRSSVHTHLRHNVLDLSAPDVVETFAVYLRNGFVAARGLSRLFDQERPDIQLLFNGRMSSTRIALELAKQRGIRTICEERSVVPGRLTLFDNTHCLDLADADALWEAWKDIPLTSAEVDETAAILEDRWRGRSTDVSAFSAGMEDAQRVRLRLGLDPAKPLWVLFTSSQDERIDEERSAGIFATQTAWIDATVAYATRHRDIQLVIRVHPNTGSDRSLGTNPQDAAFFANLHRRVPPNVHLVDAADPTSSYTLAAMADLGLIWYSTIGVEMTALGRPVIRAGTSWLADCGFFLSAPDAAGYAVLLDEARRTSPHMTADRIAGAWRFTYVSYFRQTIPFPLVHQSAWHVAEPAYKTLDELAPGKDPHLDRICAVFTSGAPLYPPAEHRAQHVAAQETIAIAARIAPYQVRA
jgi:hypothetical protein